MGRPKKEIDKDLFEEYCECQCTEEEIASFFRCSVDTISRFCKTTYKESFAEVYKKLSEGGKTSLRRKQWKLAETSAPMAIWLGKQYLGQRDSTEVSFGGKEGTTQRIEFVFTDTAMEIKDDKANNT